VPTLHNQCRHGDAHYIAPSAPIDSISTFESSPGKLRHFCRSCGSHLVAERLGQPHVIARVATLDDDPGLKPEAHIWVSHDVPWLEYNRVCKHREWRDDI
jgi:ADP-ribosyl-[dinitrogen reductase] hydrolase